MLRREWEAQGPGQSATLPFRFPLGRQKGDTARWAWGFGTWGCWARGTNSVRRVCQKPRGISKEASASASGQPEGTWVTRSPPARLPARGDNTHMIVLHQGGDAVRSGWRSRPADKSLSPSLGRRYGSALRGDEANSKPSGRSRPESVIVMSYQVSMFGSLICGGRVRLASLIRGNAGNI